MAGTCRSRRCPPAPGKALHVRPTRRPARWRPLPPAGGRRAGVWDAAAGLLPLSIPPSFHPSLFPFLPFSIPPSFPRPERLRISGWRRVCVPRWRNVPGAFLGVEAAGEWRESRGPCLLGRASPAGDSSRGPEGNCPPWRKLFSAKQIHSVRGDGEKG